VASDNIPIWWHYLVDVAQILSSIGTCGAVIVALYLANRRPRPSLSVSVRQVVLIGGYDAEPPWPRFLSVAVTNIGGTSAKVVSICWRPHRRAKQLGYQDFSSSGQLHRNKPFPLSLQPGDTEDLLLPFEGDESWLDRVGHRGFFPDIFTTRKKLESLRLCVYTTVGSSVEGKPTPELLDTLWKTQVDYFKRSASGPAHDC
jgi:hypothetical protein